MAAANVYLLSGILCWLGEEACFFFLSFFGGVDVTAKAHAQVVKIKGAKTVSRVGVFHHLREKSALYSLWDMFSDREMLLEKTWA